ncbi:MAG: tRNA pseudouridine(55) synthase TruB [Deltaproteobacteria bacterium]|nr:tRNA pseudouridine(55) synthase TruB [Deltaproteobacteria bacterium]
MNGILVIDKPSGPTSHDICQHFKRQLGAKKVGHAGTLDPLATGVLILLIDGATKLQSIFLGKDKEYQFTMRLGVETDTYDSEGKVVRENPVQDVILSGAKNLLESLLPQFTGEILQTPPPFSAIKKNGTPLYKLARRGEKVEPAPRKITVYSLEIISPLPLGERVGVRGEVTLKARCSSGTYIRSIAHDLGQLLGCGAHITQLRRLRSEPFGLEDAIVI